MRVGYNHLTGVSQFIACAKACCRQNREGIRSHASLIVSRVAGRESVLIREPVVTFDVERINGLLIASHANVVGGPKLSGILDVGKVGQWKFVEVFLSDRAEI